MPKPTPGPNGGTRGKLIQWRDNRRVNVECRYIDLDADTLRGAIDSVVEAGGAIMFGRTRDGGAYSIVVLMDDQKIKEYPHGRDEANDTLKAIMMQLVD